ncbi:MAG: endonuclease III domain-containing protein [Candidatus Aenigmatarchaeota archaeon]
MISKNIIPQIYKNLLHLHNHQGWWPILTASSPNKSREAVIFKSRYHPKDYSYPKTNAQRFEICIGAIATQNTSWIQVEKALLNLRNLNALNPENMKNIDTRKLKTALKPAGYFNQKAKKIKIFTDFYLSLNNKTPTREELLNLWGIGKETADSILLYAYQQPHFVIDAYTRRILINFGLIKEDADYDEIKALFESNLKSDYKVFQEYHALLVEHAKRYYRDKKKYRLCPLYQMYGK